MLRGSACLVAEVAPLYTLNSTPRYLPGNQSEKKPLINNHLLYLPGIERTTFALQSRSVPSGCRDATPNKIIITSKQLFSSVDPSTVVLRAGSSFRRNGTIIPIAEVKPHPEYDNPPFDKDVAYMKTAEPIQFSDTIRPIALPPKSRPLSGEIMVSGWGRTKVCTFFVILIFFYIYFLPVVAQGHKV